MSPRESTPTPWTWRLSRRTSTFPLAFADADIGGLALAFLFGDVEIVIPAAGDVVGTFHAGPLAEILSVRREDLDALVRPVADIKFAVVVKGDGVGQVKLAGAVAPLAPRFDQPSVAVEPVHAGVAVAVGHIRLVPDR